jgi:hypothetical protein
LQAPPTQVSFAPHARPHIPQLLGSSEVLVQPPAHAARPPGQVQAPPTQLSPAPHA